MRNPILIALALLASPALATDPQFGAIRVEATQNVRHAFVSGKTQGADATKVSKDEWNAAHTSPAVVLLTVPTGIVWPAQPAAVTEFCGVTSFRFRANLSNYTQIRLSAQVVSAGAATSALRLQYTTDTTGAGGWDYLDGASGPSVSTAASGVALSATVTIADAAKADVLLRLVGINGDGAGAACYSALKAATAEISNSATALAANPANCSSGSFPLGVDASGAVESCTPALVAANNLSELGTPATARDNLGLGTIATQASSSVSITGGSIAGITDLAVADGGTGASTASIARTNLGVAIGQDVQGQNANLQALADLTYAASKCTYWSSSSSAATFDCSTYGRSLIGTADAAAARTAMGLGPLATLSVAPTATALAANGANCSAGQFPLGVDASGAAESCTALPTTITGTTNQIAASASTGGVVLSIPTNPTLPGTTTGTFSGSLTGNASTTTALAANGTNCSAGSYPLGIDASGNVENCTAVSAGITGLSTNAIPRATSSTTLADSAASDDGTTFLINRKTTIGSNALGTLVVPLTVTPGTGSTAHLQIWTNSAGTPLAYVNSAGSILIPNASALMNTSGYNIASMDANYWRANLGGGQGTGNNATYVGGQANGSGVGQTVVGTFINAGSGTYNTYLGASTGGGIITGGKNTIVGARVTGLPFSLSNNVILSDGDGVVRYRAATVALSESSATTVLTVPVAATAAGITGGQVQYSAIASDGTLHQVRRGRVFYSVSNASGTETCEVHGPLGDANPDETKDGSAATGVVSGTFTYGWTVDTSGTNTCVLKLNAVSSLTQTTLKIDLTLLHDAAGIVTIP